MANPKKARWFWNLWMVLAVSLVLVPAVGMAAGQPEDEVIATLDDKPITLSEIEENAAFQIYRLRGSIFSLLQKEALEIADRRLLAQEAARQGLRVEALLEKEIDRKVAPLAEKDVDAYLAEHPEQAVKGPGGRARLRAFLEERARIQRRLDYLASLREKADYRFLARQPERPRIRVDTEGAPWRGEAQAPVTLVHFAHFSSRLCAESAQKIRHIMEEFPGRIRWVHRNFLSIQDPDALYAVETGRAAFEQGKFWEYHDRLMGLKGRVSREAINGAADAIRIDRKRFEEGQKGGTYLLQVKEDIGHGVRIGVQAAPVIFVNGIYFSGTFPFEELRALVQSELERVRKNKEGM